MEPIMPDYIFETSWEVCNKVGGIYTVLSTRAKTLREQWGDRLFFIGPDLRDNAGNTDFTEHKTLLEEWRNQAQKEGLKVRTGRWNVPGKPLAVLVDFHDCSNLKNEIYYRMWEKFGVNSLRAYGDYDESCLFACAAGGAIESLYRYLKLDDRKVIAHMNEWTLGMAVLYLKDKIPAIGTVFTTHATSIGRSICGNGKPLYDMFECYDGDRMARELNMEAKHSLEKQAAVHADCFTTVSRLTARECGQLLGRQPDVITPNGFEFDFIPKGRDFDNKRTAARRLLIDVASRLCGETIADDALFPAISGRYEYKNKGIDVFIEAMNRVRQAAPRRQIVAWIFVPAWICGARAELVNRMSQPALPPHPMNDPYYTHQLNMPENDRVCEYLRHLDFLNQKAHQTKIVFVPSYLNGNDGIFNLPYYDLLAGLDLTVFPSYYEPWGYTPLESIAFGVPTITTDLAGFGLWAKEAGVSGNRLTDGVEVVHRTDSNYFEIAERIKNSIIAYSELNAEDVAEAKSAAQTLSKKASWEHFIKYYYEAYGKALNRPRHCGRNEDP
ncbi:MAG: glycogen/starch synthase [Dysgonamonadaceae bacterium]|jgi:glycosyltransferase involved in cell wall biosynthesis|nr:glycogen/starch synthase [Dysgonamonadaceae bacterium]